LSQTFPGPSRTPGRPQRCCFLSCARFQGMSKTYQGKIPHWNDYPLILIYVYDITFQRIPDEIVTSYISWSAFNYSQKIVSSVDPMKGYKKLVNINVSEESVLPNGMKIFKYSYHPEKKLLLTFKLLFTNWKAIRIFLWSKRYFYE